ncbi:MAG: FAD-dependent oxidoreductase [Actinobacteria bacterium]|nr:FAD-dependent oxidoreductase [Actinomycetota bacterium]
MARYLIVGNGVTGMRAAEVLRRCMHDAEITLVTEEAHPFYRRPQLADYAAGAVGEARLWGKRKEYYAEQRFDLRLSSRVVGVDTTARKAMLADGSALAYDALLVASGRRLSAGSLAGADLAGINCFKTLDEARAIRELQGSGKRGVVYGNGLVALELVRALTGAGFTTTYYVPTERLWPAVLDEDAAEIAASRVRASGAELVLGARVEAVEGRGGRAAGLVLAGGETVSADVVGVCTEYTPAVDFLPDGGFGFKVDAGFATPWDGIYAAGDVTVAASKHYFNWLRSWRQGAAVGAVLAGEEGEVRPEIDVLNMQVLGLSLVVVGQTVTTHRSGYSEMRGDYPYGEFYKKLVFDPEGVLVGALLLGNVAEAGALEEAIRAGRRKDELAPSLLHQMFDVTYRTSYLGVQCPVCRHEIQLARGAHPGDLLTCPVCGTELTLQQGDVGLRARVAK